MNNNENPAISATNADSSNASNIFELTPETESAKIIRKVRYNMYERSTYGLE